MADFNVAYLAAEGGIVARLAEDLGARAQVGAIENATTGTAVRQDELDEVVCFAQM